MRPTGRFLLMNSLSPGLCRRVIVHRLAQDILGEKTDWSATTRVGVTPRFYGAVREQPPRPADQQQGAVAAAGGAAMGNLASPTGGGAGHKLAFDASLASPKRGQHGHQQGAGGGGGGGRVARDQSSSDLRRRSSGFAGHANGSGGWRAEEHAGGIVGLPLKADRKKTA